MINDWDLLRFPAIADEDQTFTYTTPFGDTVSYQWRRGELLHPARLDRATLDQLLAGMGTYNYSAQFLQSPVPIDGGLIKEAWLKTYTCLPDLPMNTLQSWDTAMTAGELSDPSVCTTWKIIYPSMHFAHYPERYRKMYEETYAPKFTDMYLIDVFRKKLSYPDLKKAVIMQKERFQASTVLIEDKSSGTPLIQDLRRAGYQGIAQYTPPAGHDKVMRMHACCGILEAGHVYLPERAEWLSAYLNELKGFPHGRHDDQVDSTSQAIHWANQGYFNYSSGSVSRVEL